jgi:hypothetical protein
LLPAEDWVSKEAKLHLVKPIGSTDMTGISRVLRDSEIIIELDSDSALSFQLVVIELVDLGMCVDNIVNALEVESVEQWFIESDPDWNSVGEMREKNFAVIDEGINEGLILIAGIVISDIGMFRWKEDVSSCDN